MNQTFKKTVIATGVAAALSISAASAFANSFSASAIADPTKKVVNTTTPAAVTINDVVLQELGLTGMSDGYVTFRIPATVKLNQINGTAITRDATTLGTAASPKDLSAISAAGATTLNIGTSGTVSIANLFGVTGADVHLDAATATGTLQVANWTTLGALAVANGTYSKVGQIYLDATTNETVITLAIKAASGSIETGTLNGLSLTPATASSTGTVALSFTDGKADGTAKTGASDDSSIPVITMGNQAVTITGTASTATVPTVTVGAVGAQPIGNLTFTFVGAANNDNNVITIALDNGAKFHSSAAATLQGSITSTVAQEQTDLRGSGNSASIAVDSQGRLVLTLGTTNIADASTIIIPVNSAVIDTSGVTGSATITATATGSGTDISTLSSSVAVATSAARSTTLTWIDDSTTGYTKVYAGRTAQTIAETVRLAEAAPASLLSGGSVTLTLDKGAKFTASDNITSTEYTSSPYADTTLAIAAITTPATAGATASGSTTAASSGALGAYDFGSFSFDLSSATVGDLTLTAGGTASATGSAKIAEIIAATSVSTSGATPNLIPGGASATLPDIVITEAKAGALSVGTAALRLPAGVTYDVASLPTITVKGSAGTALTGKVTAPAASHFVKNAAGVAASTYEFGVAVVSDATSGPFTITISGLKAVASSSAASGDASVLLHGTTDATLGDATVATAADETTSASDAGAKPFSKSFKIAGVVSATNGIYPVATVADQTKAVIAGLPLVAAGNDQGKPGAVYVAVVYQGNVFFLGANGTWSQFTSASTVPAYFTGTLGTTTLDIVKTALDLTPIKGAQIVAGYGLGIAGLSSPFDDFIKNARYNVIYTVQ